MADLFGNRGFLARQRLFINRKERRQNGRFRSGADLFSDQCLERDDNRADLD